jgi:CMP-N,N'-diacetyllegionaminic acid synthase
MRDKNLKHRLCGLILARGGSKGIPGKNIVPIGGKPLLAWTILAALQAGVLDRLVLSTDDTEIAETGLQYGAEVPFRRPARWSGDRSSSADAVVHALEWLRCKDQYLPDYVLLLQPTSPLRSSADIRKAWKLMQARQSGSVISVSEVRQHPLWMKTVDKKGRMRNFISTQAPAVRQRLPKVYGMNGAIYITSRDNVMRFRTFHCDPVYAYMMPPERSVDIDNEFDLFVARQLLAESNP